MRYYILSIPLFLVLFIQVLPFSHSGGFYAPSSGYIHATNNSNYSSVTNNNSIKNVSIMQINSAEQYIANTLGNTYYKKYLKYSGSSIFNNTAEIYFNYSIPFQNGSVTRAVYETEPLLRILNVIVYVNKNNTVINYFGPIKPYIINTSVADAINISKKYNFSNITQVTLSGVYQTNNTNRGYYIAWSVLNGAGYYQNSNSTADYYNKIYKGLYVDVSNGTVIGEFIYNPTIVTASVQNNQSMDLGYSGAFNLFNISKTNKTLVQTQNFNNTQTMTFVPNYDILLWIFLIAGIVVVIAYGVFWYLMHSK